MQGPASVDVAIVGAGAAGLSAARAAAERGLSFVVFEAKDRVGGRAHTDVDTFVVPWDRGCHWLHSASANPMRVLADRYGFQYLNASPPFRHHLGERFATEAESIQIRAYVDDSWGRVAEAGAAGRDVPIADVIDRANPWFAVFQTSVAGEWGVPAEAASTLDDLAYRDTGENWPVRDGYGALVARHADGIPVELGTPVERVEWGGTRVRVETAKGSIEAGAVVVTVSTKVIQDGVIAFDPRLPVWKQEAFDAIQLGNANKVTFTVDGRYLGADGHAGLWVKVTERQGMFFQLRPFGWDMANGYLAGELGAEAERDGPSAMIDLGLSALKTAFGSGIAKQVTASACSTWQSDPWIRGAYGAARPGQAHRRRDLATPVDERLFWAGEAISADQFSTCHGAHLTGIAAIEQIVRARP